MAKKKRNFLADFQAHMDLTDKAYVAAHKADRLYRAGKTKAADVELRKAERYIARTRKLEPK